MILRATRIRRLAAADRPQLTDFFRALIADDAAVTFHPHPLTPAAAAYVCGIANDDRETRDEYHAVLEEERIIAYGMLRGWSEGYDVPSLGIAVHPECRGRGTARQLIHHLHAVAAARGAHTVRLKVYQTNTPAVRLYESLGYQLTPCSDSELLGHIVLAPSACS